MEVEEVDALPAPASQERQTSILCDGFLPLFDESLLKRDGGSAEMSEEAQAKRKKRRSSMAATRRSITGLPGVSCSQDSVPGTDALVSSQDSDSVKGNSPQIGENHKLKPNPDNLKLDQIISEMEGMTEKLNKESKRWKEIYSEFVQRAKESEKFLENKVLYIDDIPKEIVEYGRTHYITRPLMDLDKVRADIATTMDHCRMDREGVAMDFKLLKETMLHLQRQNKIRAARLASSSESHLNEDNINLHQTKSIDPRDLIRDFLDNW